MANLVPGVGHLQLRNDNAPFAEWGFAVSQDPPKASSKWTRMGRIKDGRNEGC